MFVASRTSSILRDEIFKRRRALFCPSLCTAVQIFSGPVWWNRADGTLRGVIGQYKRDSPPDFADLPPGVGFEPKDEPLRRDINLLGRVLGQVIVEQEGKGLFGAEEESGSCASGSASITTRTRREAEEARRADGRRRISGGSCGRSRCISNWSTSPNATIAYGAGGSTSPHPENPPQRASLRSALARLKKEGSAAKSWDVCSRV
jgi:hypothetical protein